jgi:L-aminoadipate-semialdehyde dehydrogenase
MPLNPNGKIDKPALPFPDTAQVSHVAATIQAVNPTEQKMQTIWAGILPNAPSPIPLDESFFDLGGHSILATRLIFEIRKVFVVDAPLGLIFEQPTIGGLVAAVETLRNADLGLATLAVSAGPPLGVPAGEVPKKAAALLEYGQDYVNLLEKLKPSYPSLPHDFYERPVTVFLTGATGFLGAFVLKDLLSREGRVKKVICLVRSSDQEKALARLRDGSTDRGVWDTKWVEEGRLEVVVGDLGLETFGLDQETWDRVAAETDIVLHNGALVGDFLLMRCFYFVNHTP